MLLPLHKRGKQDHHHVYIPFFSGTWHINRVVAGMLGEKWEFRTLHELLNNSLKIICLA